MTTDELLNAYLSGHRQDPEPEHTWVSSHVAGLRAVAARARQEALEEAAEECDALASVEGIAQRCAAAIRARAAEGGER